MEKYTHSEKKTGTGTALVFNCGFKPKYVKVMNVGAGLSTMEHTDTMNAGEGMKRVTAGDASFVTGNGITLTDYGFILGADANVNIAGQTIHAVAHRM